MAASIYRAPLTKFDLNFVLLAAMTIAVAPRILIPIPQFKSHIAVSDTLIFLTLMLYGGEAAIVLAAVEALVSAYHFCNLKITVIFNSGTLALSTTIVILTLWQYGLYGPLVSGKIAPLDFVTALCIIAITQFICNTILAAVYDSLKDGHAFWETWKSKYVLTFPTYLAGAIGAGVLSKLIEIQGFAILFAAIPVVAFVFFAYKMYLRTVEMSIEQAEQAREYAKAMHERTVALRDSEERFRRAFDHAPIGMAIASPTGKWLKTNRALSRILGYSARDLRSLDLRSVVTNEDLGGVLLKIQEVRSGDVECHELEQRFISCDGTPVWSSLSISTTGRGGDDDNLIFQIQDISAKRDAEDQLRHEASHDALTGLPNRAYFMQRLDAAIARSHKDETHRVSVLFIDLDRFKYVNDSLGHLVGDELLIAIARRLNAAMRPPDIVARLGGDEFVVLMEGDYTQDQVTTIADRVQKKISTPFKIQGNDVYSSASIGILNAKPSHRTGDDVLRDADTAMYQAKRRGKARHEVFDETMRTAVIETHVLETDLRRAVQNNELDVFYQPVVSLADGRLYSLEALARWDHPTKGTIPPDRFIGLAEELGIIDELGTQIMRKACSQARMWEKQFPGRERFKLSVNLSTRQFENAGLVERLSGILFETGFSPNRLRLEITESVFFEHHEKAVKMLNRIRELGIETDIDDFGTGYSNLGYLFRLPISALKIDRSFVSPMSENPANREVIRTVISLARNLGLKVIAEGIETEGQMETLRVLGCDYGQGYYFAPPMNRNEMERYLGGTIAMPQGVNEIPNMPEALTIQ